MIELNQYYFTFLMAFTQLGGLSLVALFLRKEAKDAIRARQTSSRTVGANVGREPQAA
ncbi:MAG: hypothetical protein ACFB9M_00360 [Myxococcota bacterium]